MSEKVILHCDLNSFYASVECLYHPEVRGKPVAVGGETEKRHGIILTRTPEAKKYGIIVGEAIWQAKLKCPDLIIFPPRFELYTRYSQLVREIFSDYTDKIEPFGIDEAWLDVTGSTRLFGSGETIANTIRKRIFDEVGITASVGVSFNKVFAKLGSDYKKPNATTVISKDNLEEIVYPLPVSDLLYVGAHTTEKLSSYGIYTIGDLAKTNPLFLKSKFGKNGIMLWKFANGLEDDPVMAYKQSNPVKSVGNSVTSARDIYNFDDLKMVAYVLAESVGSRLRDQNLEGNVVFVYLRDAKLNVLSRQAKISYYTNSNQEIADEALKLFAKHSTNMFPLRSIGITVTNLREVKNDVQLSLFIDQSKRDQEKKLEEVIDVIRNRYGSTSVNRLVMSVDKHLTGFYPKEDHTIHPVGYLR